MVYDRKFITPSRTKRALNAVTKRLYRRIAYGCALMGMSFGSVAFANANSENIIQTVVSYLFKPADREILNLIDDSLAGKEYDKARYSSVLPVGVDVYELQIQLQKLKNSAKSDYSMLPDMWNQDRARGPDGIMGPKTIRGLFKFLQIYTENHIIDDSPRDIIKNAISERELSLYLLIKQLVDDETSKFVSVWDAKCPKYYDRYSDNVISTNSELIEMDNFNIMLCYRANTEPDANTALCASGEDEELVLDIALRRSRQCLSYDMRHQRAACARELIDEQIIQKFFKALLLDRLHTDFDWGMVNPYQCSAV